MKFSSLVTILFLLLILPAVAQADTSMKAEVPVAGQVQTWLSGLKKRFETRIPVAGKITVITRADRGIEWILSEDKKLYQEKPIALPYIADDQQPSSGASQGSTIEDALNPDSGSSEPPSDCVPELTRLPGSKVIGGFQSIGYSAACGNGPSLGKIWIAPPGGTLSIVSKEWAAFNHAHAAALYANYPPQEKAELMTMTEQFGDTLKDLLASRLGHSTQFPKGVIMAVEGKFSQNGTGPSQTVYEVKEIRMDIADPKLFEIPAGYQQVPNLTKALVEVNLKNMQAAFETMQKLGAEWQERLAQWTAPGSPLAQFGEKVRQAYENFTAGKKPETVK